MEEHFYRYCEFCRTRYALDESSCPICKRTWSPSSLGSDGATTKALIERVQDWRRDEILTAEAYETLRRRLEADLSTFEREPAERIENDSPDTPPERVAVTPPRTPGPGLGTLIAERQADILLYLGAFLLGIAALIFVSYQEDAPSAWVRVPVLVGYTLASIVGGILVRRWERVREAGHVFLGLGTLLLPLNFVLVYVDVLRDVDVSGDVVWAIASVTCLLFYAGLALRGLGSFYRVLAAAAALSGWTSLAEVLGIPGEWRGAWFMVLALVTVLVAAPRWQGAVIAAWTLGSVSLIWGYVALLGEHPEQLPATNALATGVILWSCYRLRWGWGTWLVLFGGAATAASMLWLLGAPPPTFVYPFLVSGPIGLMLRPAGKSWPGFHEAGAWGYAAVMSLASIPAIDPQRYDGWLAIAFVGSALLLCHLAWNNTEHGFTANVMRVEGLPELTNWWEHAGYAWGAIAFVLGAVAVAQVWLGVPEPHTGWAFAILAIVPAVAVAVRSALQSNRALILFVPAGAAAGMVGLPTAHPLFAAIFLAAPGVAWLVAFKATSRWSLSVVATVFLSLSLFGVRAEYAWPYWWLAVAFGGAGLVLFVTLDAMRTYREISERALGVLTLSFGLHIAAIGVTIARLDKFVSSRPETGHELVGLVVGTGEYRVLIALIAVAVLMALYEGRRLDLRWMPLTSSGAAMVPALMAISLMNPQNIQFYTDPVGAYLLALGLLIRRSPAVVPPHLQWHEVGTVVGVASIVFPQVEQSFDPGGVLWGFVLIGEALVFLVLGFGLLARWLVPSAVLVLSGVATRWLLESSDTIPYWITLGILGTVLLTGGLFVLLQAEWWNDTRTRASRWWQLDAQ